MKSLVFKNIYLLSQKERKAKEVNFHVNRNLVYGKNHTGKSSLIKSIFITLGATPAGKLRKWDTGTLCLLDLSINGKDYKILYQMGYRALFNHNNQIVLATGEHQVWTKFFSEITGFNLLVSAKKTSNLVPADPACFFLPFYIDQDGSWQAQQWGTFPSTNRFSAPQGDILEFFTGIKPSEWYREEAKRKQKQTTLTELENEREFLKRAKLRLHDNLPQNCVKINSQNFETEIRELTEKVNSLNKKQEVLRERVYEEQEILTSLEIQVELSKEALNTYGNDASYLANRQSQNLICPTCNAEHKETFLDILNYAEDARTLQGLVLSLNNDAFTAREQLNKTKQELSNLKAYYLEISEILQTKKGELEFKDIVKNMSAENAYNAFFLEEEKLQNEINELQNSIHEILENLKKHSDKKRKKMIIEDYRGFYTVALSELNMPPIEMKRQQLRSRPSLSGSGGPRELLAYYSSLWKTISKHGDFNVPIVIDSPNQQGQDEYNLPLVLEYVATKLPDNNQIIIGSEIETEHDFDNKIEFQKPYQLLDEEEYEKQNSHFSPFVNAMMKELDKKD